MIDDADQQPGSGRVDPALISAILGDDLQLVPGSLFVVEGSRAADDAPAVHRRDPERSLLARSIIVLILLQTVHHLIRIIG